MLDYQLRVCSLLIILISSNCNGCSDDQMKRPIIAALLDLHSGENCEVVNFHGIQQQAALQESLSEINSEFLPDQIQIDLRIFDTCSTSRGTRIATLKALVAAEQTCIHTPFFLGFLGTDVKENSEALRNISEVLKMAHVLPYSVGLTPSLTEYLHYITSYPVEEHTEAIKILLSKLGSRNVLVIHENISVVKLKLNHMVESLKAAMCFQAISFVNIDGLQEQKTLDTNVEDALIVLIENPLVLDQLNNYLMSYSKQIIISVGKVGVENFIVPYMKPAYILQFKSFKPLGNLSHHYNEDLMRMYNDQQLLKCSKNMEKFERKCNSSVVSAYQLMEKDWTADLFQYGLVLYAYSVRIASYTKCKQPKGIGGLCSQMSEITPSEWNNILSQSVVFLKVKPTYGNTKINFNMAISGKYMVYLYENNLLRKIASIENTSLELYESYRFPVHSIMSEKQSCLQATVEPDPISTYTSVITDLDTPTDSFFYLDTRDIEIIGFLAGIVSGIIFLITIVVYIIYSTMKVKSKQSETSSRGSSHTRMSE